MIIQGNKYVLNKVRSRSKRVLLSFVILLSISISIMILLFDWEFFFGDNFIRHSFIIFTIIMFVNSIRLQITEDKKTIIRIEVNHEKITFTSFGLFPKTVTYSSSELLLNYNKHELRNYMEVSEIVYNNELVFYYFPDLFDNEELSKSSNSFISKLINLK